MIKKLIIILSIPALILSCATSNSMKKTKGTGEIKTYSVPFENAWKEMPDIIKIVGLDFIEDNKTEGFIIAESPAVPFKQGELVIIFFMPEGKQIKLEVIAKPKLATNIASAVVSRTWPGTLFEEMDKRWKKGADLSNAKRN